MKDRRNTNTFISMASLKCPMCKSAHALYSTSVISFVTQRLQDRRALVTRCNVCFNCILEGHKACDCTNSHHCKQCKKHHHTLLHRNRREQMSKAPEIEANSTESEETSSSPTEPKQGSYSVQLKFCLPQPQSRSQTHGVLNNLAEYYLTEAHNQVILLKPFHSDCN